MTCVRTMNGLLAAMLPAAMLLAASAAPANIDAARHDPFVWLEQVDSPRAMDWVRAENAKTLGVLQNDPRFSGLYADALTIAEAQDRIPMPRLLGGQIYNLWQDAQHVRGIWRHASLAGYRDESPPWTTALDLDALAQAEGANWFWGGAHCLRPAERLCLVNLSDGGEDAQTVREFDLSTQQFVAGGFELPKSKQTSAWVDQDQLLVARDWGPGTLTASGYPFVVKSVRRGEPLQGAHEVFRGQVSDVAVEVSTVEDGSGNEAVLIVRGVSFFESEIYLLAARGVVKLNLPLKSDVAELVAGRLVIKLKQDWTVSGRRLPQGALVSLDLKQAVSDPQHLKPSLIYAPGPRESLGDVGATRSNLIVTLYKNVRGRAIIFTPAGGGGWTQRALSLPDNASIDIVSTDPNSEQAYLLVTGFLTPTSLWLADAGGDALARVKQLPAKFDASTSVVEQHEASSSDGTRIPYFVVHPARMKLDGQNPTILNAYGGFQVSNTPGYSASIGKLWLERGGTFVLANIRGGGEFGPRWHEAGLKTHRQRIFDDFTAVAEDLIARKITSPRRLGIQGGSNGGLLVGVAFTQHPALWNAADIQVPLLDMLRFEKIAAGASWVGEYGSVAHPKERAFLASISPYHNLKAGIHYPQALIWSTTKDDRVGPQHARKFAARLSAMGVPYLFYEETEGGHAAGANLKEKARTVALEMTYFTRKLMD
jgi:prolyl oligopeptidase